MVLGDLAVGYFIVSRNYDGNLLNISRNYSVWIVILWGIFLWVTEFLFIHTLFQKLGRKKNQRINGEIQTKKLKKWNL